MQFVFDPRHHVFQTEFAFFKALQLQLVKGCLFDEPRNHIVKIAMFGAQLLKAALQFGQFVIGFCHAGSIRFLN